MNINKLSYFSMKLPPLKTNIMPLLILTVLHSFISSKIIQLLPSLLSYFHVLINPFICQYMISNTMEISMNNKISNFAPQLLQLLPFSCKIKHNKYLKFPLKSTYFFSIHSFSWIVKFMICKLYTCQEH